MAEITDRDRKLAQQCVDCPAWLDRAGRKATIASRHGGEPAM